jgi:hypothetical protein
MFSFQSVWVGTESVRGQSVELEESALDHVVFASEVSAAGPALAGASPEVDTLEMLARPGATVPYKTGPSSLISLPF